MRGGGDRIQSNIARAESVHATATIPAALPFERIIGGIVIGFESHFIRIYPAPCRLLLIQEFIEIIAHLTGPQIGLYVRPSEMHDVDLSFTGGDQFIELPEKSIEVEAVLEKLNIVDLIIHEWIPVEVHCTFLPVTVQDIECTDQNQEI